MTRPDQIRLVDELIRENPDYTIRDYLDCVAEVDGITAPAPMPAVRAANRKPVVVEEKKRRGPVRPDKYEVQEWGGKYVNISEIM